MIICKEIDYYSKNKCLFIEIAAGVSQQSEWSISFKFGVFAIAELSTNLCTKFASCSYFTFQVISKINFFVQKFSKIIFKC